MKDTERLRAESAQRILDYVAANILVPAVPDVAPLTAELTAVNDTLKEYTAEQDLGVGTVSGAVVDRGGTKSALYKTLKELSLVAQGLPRATYPGLPEKMRLTGATRTYAGLAARARAIHAALEPVTAAFVARGFPATIADDLLDEITAFEEATARKHGGLNTQIGGTAGIAAACASVVRISRAFDGIYTRAYRNQPDKLAAWKAARRAEARPRSTGDDTPTTPPPSSGSTPAPAPSTGS